MTKNASRWHFNAKNGHFDTKSKYLKGQTTIFYGEKIAWHVGPIKLRLPSSELASKLWIKSNHDLIS